MRLVRPRSGFRKVMALISVLAVLAAMVPVAFADASSAGTIMTVAGNGTSGSSGDGGPATSAQLMCPRGVALDGAGNLYISDINGHRIRKIDANGTITTAVGTGTAGYSGDGGPATSAQINGPEGIAFDSSGNFYFADRNNHRIRKVDTGGTITTVVGTGAATYSGDGGSAANASINNPIGITFDTAGNLYIADCYNNRIRKVDTSGTIKTVAGTGAQGNSGDGGSALSARMFHPSGVALDTAGNLYIAVYGNNCVRKVNTSGVISTIAGNGTAGYSGDGGPATSTQLSGPNGLAFDLSGNLYIADTFNHRIRMVDANGTITTVAGNGTAGYSGDGGAALSAQLNTPFGIAFDKAGSLYIAECNNYRVRKVENGAPPQTTCAINPPSPDGAAGWYKTQPTITLTSDKPGTTYYLWDGSAGPDAPWVTYSGPITAPQGKHNLYYYSVDRAGIAGPVTGRTFQCDSQTPTAPSNLATTATSGSSTTLTWSASTDNVGVAYYLIEVSKDKVNWNEVGLSYTPSYYATSLAPNVTYCFRVRAVDVAGNSSDYSNVASALIDTQPPTQPKNIAVASSPTSLKVTWSASIDNIGAMGYKVEKAVAGSSWAECGTTTSPSFVDTAVKPNVAYYYRVRAFDAAGNYSQYSLTANGVVDATAPTSPGNLVVVRSGAAFSLVWDSSKDNVAIASYRVERSTDGTTWKTLGSTNAATTKYTDLSTPTNIKVIYRVTAFDKAGNASAPSNVASGYIDTQKPNAPADLKVSISSGSNDLFWTAATDNVGIDSYYVERSSDEMNWVQIAKTQGLSFQDSDVSTETYYYRVWAVDTSGNVSATHSPQATADRMSSLFGL